jgi:hypothetical protein
MMLMGSLVSVLRHAGRRASRSPPRFPPSVEAGESAVSAAFFIRAGGGWPFGPDSAQLGTPSGNDCHLRWRTARVDV